jgi:hypothetical protein
VRAPPPSAVASGRWGAPVAGAMADRRGAPRLAGVRNRSKFRHHGPEARRLKVTLSGGSTPPVGALQKTIHPGRCLPERMRDSRNRDDGMLDRDFPRQSALAPENLTTLAHFSVSSATSLPKSAGIMGSGSPPRSASRAFILGSASASWDRLVPR